jgi:hypothetical protein
LPVAKIAHHAQECVSRLLALVTGRDAIVNVAIYKLPALRLDIVAAIALLIVDVRLLATAVL